MFNRFNKSWLVVLVRDPNSYPYFITWVQTFYFLNKVTHCFSIPVIFNVKIYIKF